MKDSKKFFKFHARPGEDFDLWAARTEAALEAQEVFELVGTDVVGAAEGALSPRTARKVAKARALIMQGLDAKPLRMCLSEKDNPFQMWKRLRERYAVSNVATQVQLQMKLNRLRYRDQEMSDFVDSFEEIFNRLEGMGSPFPERMQVAMLLSAFGDKSKYSYGPVVAAIQTAGGENLNWEDVTARLLQEYEEKQFSHQSDSGMASPKTSHALTTVTTAGRGRSKPHYKAFGKRTCHCCGEVGHFIRNCPQRKKNWSQFRLDDGDEQNSASAHVSHGAVLTTRSARELRNDENHKENCNAEVDIVTLLDSGASEHVMNSQQYMRNLVRIKPRKIVLRDGRTVVAEQKGEAVLNVFVRIGRASRFKKLLLKDVLLVPDMDLNLVSCSALCRDGFEIHFGRVGASARKDGDLLICSRAQYGLYPVETCSNEFAVVSAARTKSYNGDLWHARLGHAHRNTIRNLIESHAVQEPSGRLPGTTNPVCGSCAREKQSRCVRHTKTVRASKVGELVHSDICGLMSCQSLGRSSYYVSFIDENSGFIKIVPIRNKSEVAAEFRKYLAWLERRAECVVKRLHNDNGGEYIALEGFLKQHGIEISRSTPYSPQENGIAERCNRTVMESARAMLDHAGMPRQFWAEAVAHASDILNRFFRPGSKNVTSYESLIGRKPRIDHLRVFGSHAWVMIPKEKRQKLDVKSGEGVVIGCLENSLYKVWLRERQIALFSRDVRVEHCTAGVIAGRVSHVAPPPYQGGSSHVYPCTRVP